MERLDQWTPESPFLESATIGETRNDAVMELMGEVIAPWAQSEGPFQRDEAAGGELESEAVQVMGELLADLEDEGFTAAVYEMAAEAQEAVGQKGAGGGLAVYASQEAAELEAERGYEQHFAGLAAEAERLHSAVAEGFSRYDLTYTSEAELESLVTQFVPALSMPLSPAQEQFIGALVRKIGGAVKGVVNLARKGVQAVGKGIASVGRTVIAPLLRKLGRIVKPLLKRVIQFAMGKLPAAVRPIASKLADRLFGRSNEFEGEQGSAPLASAPSAHNLQMEYNFQIAEAVLTAQEAEGRPEAESEQFAGPVVAAEGTDIAGRLHEATRQLAENLAALKEGEDPRPAIQQFLPAALLALQPIIKGVIAIIGRDKVVNFVAGLIAKLISRWVGPEPAKALARPVVSVGLGMLGFEAAAQQDPRLAAAEILAQTVQETVLHLVQQAPASFEQPNLVQALTMEAFEAAAQANFPSDAMRPELRETSEGSGQWRLMPTWGRRRWYKKYSQVFDMTLDPGAMRRVKTFAGVSLAEMLGATAGINTDKPLKARIYVYELTIGSRLIDISRFETGVGGLGTIYWTSWGRLMPLTPEAAAQILPQGAAGLGRDPGPQFLQGAYLTAPGQRFYHIEVPGEARPAAPPKPPEARKQIVDAGNDVGIIFNLIRGAITVKMRLSEATAQEIATYLRRGDVATPIQIMRRALGGLEALRQGQLKVGYRVEGETTELREYLEQAQQGENFLPAAFGAVARQVGNELLSKLASKLLDALWAAVAKYLANKSAQFITATEDPKVGVTVKVAFEGIDSLKRLRDIRDGKLASGVGGFLADRLRNIVLPFTALPMPSLSVEAGEDVMDRDFTVFSQQTERQLQHWHAAAQLLRRHDLVASSQAWASLESYVGASIRQSLLAACDQLLREFAIVRARFNAARSLAALDEVAGAIVQFRDSYMRVETLVDFYGDAINSRTGPELGAKLKAFDYVAGLSMQRMLRPLGQRTPPVLTYLDKGLGASILRAGLRLWDGGTMSPVAAVKVTFHNQERPTAIVHETGHQVAAILDWNEELTRCFETRLAPEGAEVARIWASWATEVAADAYGFANVGFAAVAALSNVVAGSPPQVFAFNPGGVHPISYLRVLLGYAMARRMYGYGLWDDLERAWRARYAIELAPVGFRPTLQALERAIPKVVELSLLTPMRAFGGQSLADRIDPMLVSPQALARLQAEAGPALLTSPHWLATESLRLIALTGYRFAVDPARAGEQITLHRDIMERIGNALPNYRAAA